MAKLPALFSSGGKMSGRLVWMGLAHAHKHLLSVVVSVRIQFFSLDLTGQGRSKGVFPATPRLESLVRSREMLLSDLGAEPRPLSLHSRTCNKGFQSEHASHRVTFPMVLWER